MSALGQKQTCAAHKVMSALHPKADMCGATAYVRKGPKADIMASAEASLAARWQLRLCYSALHGDEHAKVAIHRPAWRRSHVPLGVGIAQY